MEARPKRVVVYETAAGKCPFLEWLKSLRDIQGRAIIRKRIDRLALGNMGDHRHPGDGVSELKIALGPGYRVYFGENGDE